MPNGNPVHDIDKYSAIEAHALTLDDKAKGAEILKNLADVRNSYEMLRIQRLQLKTTKFSAQVPMWAFIGTILLSVSTLFYQSTLQRDASEDEQWREALKSVSFKDPLSSQISALSMQGFFSSRRYGSQAREIASILLTNVPNVNAFDEVMERMGPAHTDSTNFGDLVGIGQMLGLTQRARFHIQGAASRENTPFLMEAVSAIEANPKNLDDKEQQTRVAAWQLDTTSSTLRNVWTNNDPQKRLSPAADQSLQAVVLENANFEDLDFTGAHFNWGILYNASFKRAHFNRATLRDVYIYKVALDDADFSGVTVYDGSRWENSNWWDAKCIPQQMLDYLLKVDPHPLTLEAKSKLVSNCH
jgi:hypothetical protein